MSRTILIVDDDPFIRALIATTLEDIADFELVEAADGQQAIETRVAAQPEIVFLDLDMGRGLDGMETCRRLRSEPSTADCRDRDADRRLRRRDRATARRGAGVDLFLTKPFSPLGLLRLVDELA